MKSSEATEPNRQYLEIEAENEGCLVELISAWLYHISS